MKLIILRGPSGTGKTTIARYLGAHGDPTVSVPHHEADEYFVNPLTDKYKFNPVQLGNAHKMCQLVVERDMFHHIPLVIVSNTSTRVSEMKPYLNLARTYGYEVEIIRTPGPWDPDALFDRNIHSVPLETLRKQIERYVAHADETEWSDMTIFRPEV